MGYDAIHWFLQCISLFFEQFYKKILKISGTVICGGLKCVEGSKGCKVDIQTTYDNRFILTTRECYDINGK